MRPRYLIILLGLILFIIKLQPPHSLKEFLSSQSPWNPTFFAYGSFPIYLLWILGHFFSVINPLFSQYDLINLLGRSVSALFDTGTILIVFLLGQKIQSKKAGLVGAFFYAISVLPIQLSHFYAVD